MRLSKETVIIGIVGIAFALFIGFLILKTPGGTANPVGIVTNTEALIRENSHRTGKIDAKVKLVEFGDFQCPACAQLHPYLKQVVDKFKDNENFTFVFRNFPLPQHKNAIISAEAAEAAGAQGKYWEMFDMIYEHQNDWSESNESMAIFTEYAKYLNLDVIKFADDLSSHKFVSFINADKADGNSLQVNHTPTVYLNGVELQNMDPAVLIPQIEVLLNGDDEN